MSGGMYVIADDGTVAPMRERRFETEAILQALLADYPDLLSGDQVDESEPRRWILVGKEAPLASSQGGADRWAIDHLFLDQDAIPTIVEVKRSGDTRMRREVVGQMLDYAANGVMYWPVNRLRHFFESRCQDDGVDPVERLAYLLGISAPDPDLFWANVETNLRAGNVRLTFVADTISTELRRIVEFLSEQMQPAQVVAVEVKEFDTDKGHRTLVAKIVCQTARAQQNREASRSVPVQWDEAMFLAKMEKLSPAHAELSQRVIRRAQAEGMGIKFGKGAEASFRPVIEIGGTELNPFTVHDYSGGIVELRIENIRKREPFTDAKKRTELIEQVNAIPGVTLPERRLEYRPSFPLLLLDPQESMDRFFEAIAWCIRLMGEVPEKS